MKFINDNSCFLFALIIVTHNMSTEDQSLNRDNSHDPLSVAGTTNTDPPMKERLIQSCQKLARAKTKYTLLCDYPDEDIFSSVRPKIGKVFSTDGFEERKKELLKSCRHNIIELGKEEALEISERAKLNHSRIVGELQSLPPAQYRDLLNFSYRYEKKLLEQFTSKHQRKIEYHWRKKNIPGEPPPTQGA